MRHLAMVQDNSICSVVTDVERRRSDAGTRRRRRRVTSAM
jgi:hypothetical protein